MNSLALAVFVPAVQRTWHVLCRARCGSRGGPAEGHPPKGELADNSRTSFSLEEAHQESIGPASLYLAECR